MNWVVLNSYATCSGGIVLSTKVIRASTATPSPPHHSTNKVGPRITDRVCVSCEPWRSHILHPPLDTLKQKRRARALCSEMPAPPHPRQIPPTNTMPSAGYPTLFSPGSTWTELGSTSFLEHVLGMLAWPPGTASMRGANPRSAR